MHNNEFRAVTFSEKTPNMVGLKRAFDKDRNDAHSFFQMCEDSYNQKNCLWPNKSQSLRKDYAGAKPWIGASDQEVNLIGPRVDTMVSVVMNAINNGHITAFPVGSDDLDRSVQISNFLRWALDSWIPDAKEQVRRGLFSLYMTGLAKTFVWWEKKKRQSKEEYTVDLLAQIDQEMTERIINPDVDIDELTDEFKNEFPGAKRSDVKKLLIGLRERGVGEIDVIKDDINRPMVQTLSVESEILMPSYTTEFREADRIHCAFIMTAQSIRASQVAEKWDKKWADDIIENHMGLDDSYITGSFGFSGNNNSKITQTRGYSTGTYDELTMIVRTLRRLVDEETGAVGIYETVWCPMQPQRDDSETYGKHSLLDGWDEYPVASKTFSKNRRMYDQRPPVQMLRGTQRQAKVTRDSYTNQADLASAPPMTYPSNREPPEWGANAKFPIRPGDRGLYEVINIPNTRPEGVQYEQYLDREADFIMGLSQDDPLAIARQQDMINIGLEYVSDILRLFYKCYQKYYNGPDIIFRVTGDPDPQQMRGGYNEEELDISIKYDSRLSNPDYVKEMAEVLRVAVREDSAGRIDRNKATDVLVKLGLPMFASSILKPVQEAREEIIKNIVTDLTQIWAGHQIGARQFGAEIAIEYIGQYLQKASVQTRMEQDEEFAANVELYLQQYQRQMIDRQNAVIGGLGTAPAELQGINE